jgi:hypothetical protein
MREMVDPTDGGDEEAESASRLTSVEGRTTTSERKRTKNTI